MMKKGSEVVLPNLGLYFDTSPIGVPGRGYQDCHNIRIQEGQPTNLNIGWSPYSTHWALNGPVKLIDSYVSRLGQQKLIFASLTDLYEWVEASDTILYLTPRYNVGTASVVGTSVTVTGGQLLTAGVKTGDYISFGSNAQRDLAATWYKVDTVNSETSLTLVSSAPSFTGAYTIRQCFTGSTNDVWSTTMFYDGLPGPTDWWAGTNGVDHVVSWDGVSGSALYQKGLGFTCKALLRWNNMMIYGNLTIDGGPHRSTSIANSDLVDPFNNTDGVAAQLVVHDGSDEIVAMYTFASYLVIYSLRTITLVSFVGLPQLFAFRQAIKGVGLIAQKALADFGDKHEFLGQDSAYEFDGVTIKEIHYQVMREVIRKMVAQRHSQIIVHFSEETGEVWWIVPLSSDPSQLAPKVCYSEHYLENFPPAVPAPFTRRDMPATAMGHFASQTTLTWDAIPRPWSSQNYRWDDRLLFASFPLNLMGLEDGTIMKVGVADTMNGVAFRSFVHFGLRSVIDGLVRGCIRRVYAFATRLPSANYPLNVTVYTTDQVGGTQMATLALPYDLTQAGRRFVNPFVNGRFFSVEFSTDGPEQVWTLQGYDIDVAPLGERGVPI